MSAKNDDDGEVFFMLGFAGLMVIALLTTGILAGIGLYTVRGYSDASMRAEAEAEARASQAAEQAADLAAQPSFDDDQADDDTE